jgi:ribosomal protein L37E
MNTQQIKDANKAAFCENCGKPKYYHNHQTYTDCKFGTKLRPGAKDTTLRWRHASPGYMVRN